MASDIDNDCKIFICVEAILQEIEVAEKSATIMNVKNTPSFSLYDFDINLITFLNIAASIGKNIIILFNSSHSDYNKFLLSEEIKKILLCNISVIDVFLEEMKFRKTDMLIKKIFLDKQTFPNSITFSWFMVTIDITPNRSQALNAYLIKNYSYEQENSKTRLTQNFVHPFWEDSYDEQKLMNLIIEISKRIYEEKLESKWRIINRLISSSPLKKKVVHFGELLEVLNSSPKNNRTREILFQVKANLIDLGVDQKCKTNELLSFFNSGYSNNQQNGSQFDAQI